MQKIIFIHGANCSPVIWNYLAPKIKGKRDFVAYDTAIPFEKNLEEMKQDLAKFKDAVIVAHSMGGLYAAHLVHAVGQYGVRAVVTISTPFNGSEKANQLALMFPDYQMLHDIASNSKPVRKSQEVLANIYIPWLQVVSTKGHVPLISRPNDGVVSIDSQKYIKNMNCVELPFNHFEILLNEDTASVVNEFISGLK
jgi:pimeloyl-ACP methyl ester carboxylesterase